MKKRVLFLAFYHRVNDPRLMYREMKLLKSRFNDLEISVVRPRKEVCNSISQKSFNINIGDGEINVINIIIPRTKLKFFSKLYYNWKAAKLLLKIIKQLRPNVIQASDARELFLAFLLKRKTKAKLVYDSHEDYVRQVLDYQGKSLKSYVKAFMLFLNEFFFIRYCEHVFCTDEYLLKKYRKKLYGSKKVSLLRNFPYVDEGEQSKLLSRDFVEKNKLKLVYIGGVNKYRGVIECAKYVKRFNNEFIDKSLSFDVYSFPNKITDLLVSKKLINHIPWIDYSDLMVKLSEYDVGICLWLPIKKFYRNLPLKNFDYMRVGLPIITSNFGNLKNYIDDSKSGICIDPTSYKEFKKAILRMFSPETRKYYSNNGIKYTANHASFQIEGKEYIEFFKKV